MLKGWAQTRLSNWIFMQVQKCRHFTSHFTNAHNNFWLMTNAERASKRNIPANKLDIWLSCCVIWKCDRFRRKWRNIERMKDLLRFQQKWNFRKDKSQANTAIWAPFVFLATQTMRTSVASHVLHSHTGNSNGNNNYLFISITKRHKHACRNILRRPSY